jgi:hypothetical protein
VIETLVFITMYLESIHQGDPLYCDRGQGYIYDQSTIPWVALPPGPGWECGDSIVIWDDGIMREFVALDSWVNGSCIIEGDDCIKIGADVPEHLAWWGEGLSTRAIVINQSEAKRRLTIEQ